MPTELERVAAEAADFRLEHVDHLPAVLSMLAEKLLEPRVLAVACGVFVAVDAVDQGRGEGVQRCDMRVCHWNAPSG